MMRLDQETDLAVGPSDQGIQRVGRYVDHRLAVGALQMRMRGCGLVTGRRYG